MIAFTPTTQATPSSINFTTPKRLTTVMADVYAQLLKGKVLTGLSAVKTASTTRLAAVIHRLKREYRLPIYSMPQSVGCEDGRLTTVEAYYLPPWFIDPVMATPEGRDFVAGVTLARVRKRAHSDKAKREAARRNLQRPNPCQRQLWGDV
jgi:hypothetical protein